MPWLFLHTIIFFLKCAFLINNYYRIVIKLFDVLLLLLGPEENRMNFSNAGLVGQVDLAARMNKKNVEIANKAVIITGAL